MTGKSAALERRDPSPSVNQYDHVATMKQFGSSEDMEPWDEGPDPISEPVKVRRPVKSTGLMFCVDELLGPTDHDDEPLEDGDLPSLSRSRSRSRGTPIHGRVVNGQRTTKKPMSPPSQAGLVHHGVDKTHQLHLAYFSKSNMDADDDLPDDERDAQRKQDRKRTNAAKHSRESELYADEIEIDPTDEDELNLCDYTLQSLTEICGSPSDSPSKLESSRQPYQYDSRRTNGPTMRDQSSDAGEQTAIEVEYVDPKRGRPPQNATEVDYTNDDTAIDDDTHAQSTASWSPQRKNAYLAAMARKAREDFEKKHQNTVSSTSTRKEIPSMDDQDDDADNVYNSFTATEKRKFLKHINSGMTPTESSAVVLAEREKLQSQTDTGNELEDSKTGNKEANDRKSARFMFWKKGSKTIDDEGTKSSGKTGTTIAMVGAAATKKNDDEIAIGMGTPRRSGGKDRGAETATVGSATKKSAETTTSSDFGDLADEFGISESTSEPDDYSPSVAAYSFPKQEMNELSRRGNVAVSPADVASSSSDPQIEFPKSGNNFYDAVRVERPEEQDNDDDAVVAAISRNQSKRSSRLASMLVSPRTQGFSSMGENGKDDVLPLNKSEYVDQTSSKAILGMSVGRRQNKQTPEMDISTQNDDGRRRILGLPIPGSKRTGFMTLDDDGRESKPEPEEIYSRALESPLTITDKESTVKKSPISPLGIQNGELDEDYKLNDNLRSPSNIQQGRLSTPQKYDQSYETERERDAIENNGLDDREKTLLRPVVSTDEDNGGQRDDGFYLNSPKSMTGSHNQRHATDINSSLDNYLDSSIYSTTQGQDQRSVWTAATGMTGSSSITQSSRKRRPGAAKERLAKAKEADKRATTKKGWHQSMQASANNFNTAWDPNVGFADYMDTNLDTTETELDSVNADKKLKLNLSATTERNSKYDNSTIATRQSEASALSPPVSLPFPSEWEKERSAMIRQPIASHLEDKTGELISEQAKASPAKPMVATPEIEQVTGPIWDHERGWIGSNHHSRQPAENTDTFPSDSAINKAAIAASSAAIRPRRLDSELASADFVERTLTDERSLPQNKSPQPATLEPQDPGREMGGLDQQPLPLATDLARVGDKKQTISGEPVDDKPLNSWIQKSGQPTASRSELSTAGSDQAVASISEEKYVQLGDNGLVRSYSKQQSPIVKMPARKKVDPPAMTKEPVVLGTASPEILEKWTENTVNDVANEDDTAPLLANEGEFQRSSDERTPPVQVIKQKCDEDDISLFVPDARASFDAATTDRPPLSPVRSSGPVDLDDSVTHSDTDDDEDWEPDSFLQGQVSNSLFANAGNTRIPEAVVPKLNKPLKDSSPLRTRSAVTETKNRKGIDASGTIAPVGMSMSVASQVHNERNREETDLNTNELIAVNVLNITDVGGRGSAVTSKTIEARITEEVESKHNLDTTANRGIEVEDQFRGDGEKQSDDDGDKQSNDVLVGTSPACVVAPGPSVSTGGANASAWDNATVPTRSTTSPSNSSLAFKPLTPTSLQTSSRTINSRGYPVLYTSASTDTDVSTPSAVSSNVKIRAQQWESKSGKSSTSIRKSRVAVVSPVDNKGISSAPSPPGKLSEVPQMAEIAWPENKDDLARAASPTGSAAGYKAFLEKKVRAESEAAAKKEETMKIGASVTDHVRSSSVRHTSVRDRSITRNEKDGDDDSLFEFQSTSDNGQLSSRNHGVLKNAAILGSKRSGTGVSDTTFPDISPIQTQDEDDSIGEGSSVKNTSKFETTSDTGTDIEQGSFLKRLSACAAQFSYSDSNQNSMPMAHLAFLKTNPPVTRGTAPTLASRSSGRFVPPNLCGRPETIIENDSTEVSPQEATFSSKYRSTPLANPSTTAGDFKSSSSVVSGDFGAKTSYFDNLAMKAAVSDPKRSGSRSKSRGKGLGASSDVSTSSKQSSERWNEFLERKSQTGSSTEVSKAAERYAAEKVEEMMEALAAKPSGRQGGNTQRVDAMLDNMAAVDSSGQSLPSFDTNHTRPSDTLSNSGVKRSRKSESAKAAEELAAARVEAMMAAMTSSNLDDGEI